MELFTYSFKVTSELLKISVYPCPFYLIYILMIISFKVLFFILGCC